MVPADFTQMAPYVTTLLVLALASQRLRMPAADGAGLPQGLGRMSLAARAHGRVDWDALRSRAVEAATHAYAPYSRFRVGAAALRRRRPRRRRAATSRTRRTAWRCAPSAAWSPQLHLSGGGRLTHFVCVNGDGR